MTLTPFRSRLDSKVALVTGGAAGIGRACALRFAAEGAAVVVSDIDGEGAAEVAELICSSGGRAVSVVADVSQEAAVAAMVATAVRQFGRLDILHNNAALVRAGDTDADGAVADMDIEVWDRTMAVNLRGPMLGCKHAIPIMIADGGGAIINTSSGASITANARLSAYAASKSGLNTLTRYVAKQYGKSGIRCNAVVPGVIVKPKFSEEFLQASLRQAQTPYLGEPDDVAACVAFLASEEARFITGQLIAIDGGFSAR